MITTEGLHAQPDDGGAVLPCCGRTLEQLPPYDRVVREPGSVTCGRLSFADELKLSGQPVILDAANEQILFAIASTLCTLTVGGTSLRAALASVNSAVREVIPSGQPLTAWSADLMVAVTERAQALLTRD